MIKETVVWTLLPDPSADPATGEAQLSLVFGFQLSTDEGNPAGTAVLPLCRYPHVSVWPDFAFELSVRIKKPTGESVTVRTTVSAVPEPALWRALFPDSSPVQPFLFDRTVSKDPIQSYPTRLVAGALREEYGRLFTAAGGTGRPGQWDAVDGLVRRVGLPQGSGIAVDPFNSLLRQGVLPDDIPQDPAGWVRLADFHRPLAVHGAGRQAPPSQASALQRDVHALLAALADHPALMTAVGLVRQVKFALPTGLEGPVTIQAVPLNSQFVNNYVPCTQCLAQAGRLVLARAGGSAAALHLPLDDAGRFTVVDFDVDAGALALQSYANALSRLPRDGLAPALRAPTLHTDGIFVAEKDRQVTFQNILKQAELIDEDLGTPQPEPGDAITLDGDNVQQGYRVDVYDEGSRRWYPLCRRVGAYTVHGSSSPVPVDDEGSVTDALARGFDEQGHPVSRLHQSLFRWHGWSLIAEPPGKMLDLSGRLQDPAPMGDPTLPFAASFGPPARTLPSLRYGRSYRFRARLVDLAGRSLPFTEQPSTGEPATAPLRYSRYEPVPAPILVSRRPVTYGESVAVLVVRTDNRDPTAPVKGPACERHLLAPKAAVLMLERHGVLDVGGEHRLDPGVYALLKRLDGGVVTGPADAGAGGTPYVDTDAMDLPWLPDPLSDGMALHGLPGTPELLVPWPRDTAWYQRFPLRLVAIPGTAAAAPPPPVVTPAKRLVELTLAPGTAFSAPLSSMLSSGDEEIMGLWHWFADTGTRTPQEIAETRAHAIAGRVAQLTPTTELHLVHAVPCPVAAPAFGQPRILREPHATAYVLDDQAVAIHRASTQSLHTEAAWTQTVDDTTQPGPTTSSARALLHPDSGDVPETGAVDTVPFTARHDAGDTRHHMVQFTPVGTSRFVAYFTERKTLRLTGTNPQHVADAFVPGTAVVRAAVPALTDNGTPGEPGTAYSPERDVLIRDATGDVARREGGAVTDGQSVEVSFVVPPVTRAGASVTLHVPATTRPPAPAVHSVVPAFRWQEDHTDGVLARTRKGGAVRVYLERPWYLSGEGELLAVLVLGQTDQPDDSSEQWATMWGRDPIREAGAAPVIAFPRPADLVGAIPMTVSPGQAMGYPVAYDSHRRLWYADVQFLADNLYQPFVRLKVARLQPDALTAPEDLRLSTVADAGFVQLPTTRRASVTLSGTNALVTVSGPVPPAGPDGLSTKFTALLQARGRSTVDDPVDWQTLTGVTPVDLALQQVTNQIGLWTGTLTVQPSTVSRRILVQETDTTQGTSVTGERLSYFDTFNL
ncbi:hypothetical protein ACGFRG_02075 [Streptomyces sp. NPDC048696]|uniref:hypothetical protein n=1 Tax=Streptomyces sp. NPDC048696 TaxID=3365585 RepID=UPI003714E15A